MIPSAMFPLALLITVLVAAVGTAAYAYQGNRRRRSVLMRVDGQRASVTLVSPLLPEVRPGLAERIGDWVAARLPSAREDGTSAATEKLVQAGFDTRSAPGVYTAARVGTAFALPILAFLFAPAGTASDLLLYVGIAAAIAAFGPPAVLDRFVQRRRNRIRLALPDALDLLVVCVEAGVSLDAALLRVARDIGATHPELGGELMGVVRKVNAGVPRERALHSLWERTGLDEVRALASNMVQSERWGTSIAKVLRINAETLRGRRKQEAEKKAAQATIKMMFPLLIFLFPALFVVILGPVALRLGELNQ
jgi:tight adherence protein C